ncbi:prepilin-type N-terminal cleavage/methylation domain-containing protein [Patescibacteria group bacterium]|nr:prepilin-type N-terminal cleavage/methylation domain-containing protein [Patescibacteria group bacterium]
MRFEFLKNRGFTLLEIIVVMMMFAIIVGGLFAYSRDTLVSTQFHTVVYEIKHSLLTSENYSRANYLNVRSGMSFDDNFYTVFFADTYSSIDTANIATELPSTIYFSEASFGGDSILYFSKFTGIPDSTGTITINDYSGRQASISIDTEGVIDITYN